MTVEVKYIREQLNRLRELENLKTELGRCTNCGLRKYLESLIEVELNPEVSRIDSKRLHAQNLNDRKKRRKILSSSVEESVYRCIHDIMEVAVSNSFPKLSLTSAPVIPPNLKI
jgi:hypothetical protein